MRRGLTFLPGKSGSLCEAIGTSACRVLSRVGVPFLLLLLSVSNVFAQAPVPAHGLNPNFGTYSIGSVEIQLAATGGTGTYTWQVVGGALPPGVSLRSDANVWPSWVPNSASAMLLGIATTPGTYNFTLRVTS